MSEYLHSFRKKQSVSGIATKEDPGGCHLYGLINNYGHMDGSLTSKRFTTNKLSTKSVYDQQKGEQFMLSCKKKKKIQHLYGK